MLKRILSVLLVFLLFFSFPLPINLGVEAALASPSPTKLIYPESNTDSFYKKFVKALEKRENIVIYTDFSDYSEFPDDLQEVIKQTEEGTFTLNVTKKLLQYFTSTTIGGIVGGVSGAIIGTLIGDPVDGAIWGGTLGSYLGSSLGDIQNNEHYGYIVKFIENRIYLDAVSTPSPSIAS